MLGVTGSVEKRNKLASHLNKKFYLLTRDVFDKRVKTSLEPYITPQEIENRLTRLADGVLVDVSKNTSKGVNGSIYVNMNDFGTYRAWGYDIKLPLERFEVQKCFGLKKESIETLCHETRHLFDFVTQPKRISSMHKFEVLEGRLSHWKVYKKNLYGETPADSTKEKIALTLRDTLNNHFDKMKTPLSERITILQEFRYSLQSESNAKKDGLFYLLKPRFEAAKNKIKKGEEVEIHPGSLDLSYKSANYGTKTQKMKALNKCEKITYDYNIKNIHDEIFFFGAKIKILEEMIYENIVKVRAELKASAELKLT